MESFKFGHASALEWQSAAQSCLAQVGELTEPANLGFLYTTDLFVDKLSEILNYFKQRTGITHWVGTVGMGICSLATEYFDTPAIAVMLGHFPEHSFRVFHTVHRGFKSFSRSHQAWCHQQQPLFGIVHGDPRNPRLPELILELSEQLEEGFLVGGLTSSRGDCFQISDNLTEGGLSGVLFSNEIQVATQLTQGCSIIGPRHYVTECFRNIMVRIDNRPALDVFNEEIGKELASDLEKVAGQIFAALPVIGSDTGDYVVRNIVGIDPDRKLIAIGDAVKLGMPILFARRDAKTAHDDLVKMLTHLKKRIHGLPKGGVYYSCLGRGENLFGQNSQELKTIQQFLGEFPLVGFFANGEISHQRLYGYTGVLSLFL